MTTYSHLFFLGKYKNVNLRLTSKQAHRHLIVSYMTGVCNEPRLAQRPIMGIPGRTGKYFKIMCCLDVAASNTLPKLKAGFL